MLTEFSQHSQVIYVISPSYYAFLQAIICWCSQWCQLSEINVSLRKFLFSYSFELPLHSYVPIEQIPLLLAS